jgi:transcriptional regulator with XRE-family HTH domain
MTVDLDTQIELRSRMLGALLRDARLALGRPVEACAEAMGCTPDDYAAFEAGDDSPSLPELELLAYSLGVPLRQFFGHSVLAAGRRALAADDVLALRHRVIGARLRQCRLNARLTLGALAEAVALPADDLEAYESGEAPVPLPELEVLAAHLGCEVQQFFEDAGPIGEWDSAERAASQVRALPPELRRFVAEPANESFLRLAHELAQLPNARLRAIAQSLLDITL